MSTASEGPAAAGASPAGSAGAQPLPGGSGGSSAGGGLGRGGGVPPGECSLTIPGATGEEPDGTIPICCSPTEEERAQRDTLLEALDEYRADEGLGALASDPALQAAAQGFARHMDEHPFFDSSAPEAAAGTVWQAAALCGAHVTAANLAASQGGPLDVLNIWIQTPSTDLWLVDPEFTRVGLGTHGYRWCLLLD